MMMVRRCWSIVFVLLVILATTMGQQQDQESIIELQHFIDNKFSMRSSWLLKRTPASTESTGSDAIISPIDKHNGIGAEDLDNLKGMLKKNALYRIRIVTRDPDDPSLYKTAIASIPVCELQKSGFKEDVVLHMDSRDQIIGLSYSAPEMTISRSCDSDALIPGTIIQFQTRVRLAEPDVAQMIPIQVFGPKPMTMQSVQFHAQTDPTAPAKQQQGYQPILIKYWYIVVPMCVYLIVGSFTDVPKKGGSRPSGAAAVKPS